MKSDKPIILPIQQIITENARVKTFVFAYDMAFRPGQFVMTWIPGYDEKPFGIVSRKAGEFMITVASVGESTKALHVMHVGDLVGFRGPFGSSFVLPKSGEIAIVAGGYGMVPLSSLAQEARNSQIVVHLFIGARSKDELLYLSWMKDLGVILHISTDNGSEGYKGFNTDLFAQYIDANDQRPTTNVHFDKVYTVGPEVMEMKVAETCYANNIPFELSLERYMKCGIGICGQCCVDPTGWRMCVEGPVVDGEKLKQITEFGKYHRTASGKIEKYPWAK